MIYGGWMKETMRWSLLYLRVYITWCGSIGTRLTHCIAICGILLQFVLKYLTIFILISQAFITCKITI